MLALADEATHAGARLEKAAEQLGVSARTIQRWIDDNGGEDARRGKEEHDDQVDGNRQERVDIEAGEQDIRNVGRGDDEDRQHRSGPWVEHDNGPRLRL